MMRSQPIQKGFPNVGVARVASGKLVLSDCLHVKWEIKISPKQEGGTRFWYLPGPHIFFPPRQGGRLKKNPTTKKSQPECLESS